MQPSGKTALIVGATGLVGKELLQMLLSEDDYSKVIVVGRRTTGISDSRLEEVLIDFAQLTQYKDRLSAHHYFCCLGTTMKQAKTEEAFYQVDYTYVLELAKMAQASPHLEQFHLVTAYGANAQSGVFYNAVKGEIEEAVQDLNLSTLHVYRPSLLLGKRKEFRFSEELGKVASAVLSFFVVGSRLKFWSIEASQVAAAMQIVAKSGETGIHTHSPIEMKEIASRKAYKSDSRTPKSP